jgi:hypothetical protein
MTPRQAFDKVWQYAVIEDKPLSFVKDGVQCLYRSPEGNKCWIGCLIPDEIYEPDMDDSLDYLALSIENVRARHKSLRKLFHRIPNEFLGQLQAAHDSIVSRYSDGNKVTIHERHLPEILRLKQDKLLGLALKFGFKSPK